MKLYKTKKKYKIKQTLKRKCKIDKYTKEYDISIKEETRHVSAKTICELPFNKADYLEYVRRLGIYKIYRIYIDDCYYYFNLDSVLSHYTTIIIELDTVIYILHKTVAIQKEIKHTISSLDNKLIKQAELTLQNIPYFYYEKNEGCIIQQLKQAKTVIQECNALLEKQSLTLKLVFDCIYNFCEEFIRYNTSNLYSFVLHICDEYSYLYSIYFCIDKTSETLRIVSKNTNEKKNNNYKLLLQSIAQRLAYLIHTSVRYVENEPNNPVTVWILFHYYQASIPQNIGNNHVFYEYLQKKSVHIENIDLELLYEYRIKIHSMDLTLYVPLTEEYINYLTRNSTNLIRYDS